jgi:hypothetical protein
MVWDHRCRTWGDFENVSTLVELCAKRTEDETSPSANIRCPSSTIGHMLVNLKKSSGNTYETPYAGEGGEEEGTRTYMMKVTVSPHQMARLDLE